MLGGLQHWQAWAHMLLALRTLNRHCMACAPTLKHTSLPSYALHAAQPALVMFFWLNCFAGALVLQAHSL